MNANKDELPDPADSPVPTSWMRIAATLRRAGAGISDDAWRRCWVEFLIAMEERDLSVPDALSEALETALG